MSIFPTKEVTIKQFQVKLRNVNFGFEVVAEDVVQRVGVQAVLQACTQLDEVRPKLLD